MLEYLVENIADECPDMKFVSIKLAEDTGPRGGNIQIDALGSRILCRRTCLQEHVRCTSDEGYEYELTHFFGLGMAFSFVKYNSDVGNIFL
ncbi:hypothetical protein CBL_10334 [Carabus blaptoides fortunei]